MKVEFLQSIVGRDFAYYVGDVRTLPNGEAKRYVEAGIAKVVASPPQQRAERAVTGKKGNKKKKK